MSHQRRLHKQIGLRLEQAYGERVSEIATALAMHWQEAWNTRQALRYRRQAAENALGRHAYREAIAHLTTALELLHRLPDTPERAQHELTMHIALGTPLMAMKGTGASEVERAYTRARELCRQVEETPQLFPVLWGLWSFYHVRAELQTARELGEQCLMLAQRAQEPTLRLQAHHALGPSIASTSDIGQWTKRS